MDDWGLVAIEIEAPVCGESALADAFLFVKRSGSNRFSVERLDNRGLQLMENAKNICS